MHALCVAEDGLRIQGPEPCLSGRGAHAPLREPARGPTARRSARARGLGGVCGAGLGFGADRPQCTAGRARAAPWPVQSGYSTGRSLRNQIFFILLRTALKDRPKGPPIANRQLPPTANRHQPPTSNRLQPPPTASGDQPPTANHYQPPFSVKDRPATRATRDTGCTAHTQTGLHKSPRHRVP